MVTWVTKKSIKNNTSPKAYGHYKVTASKFIAWRLKRWVNLITIKDNIFLSEKCAGKNK